MSELAEFLAMGGYGLYVWSAYGVTALVLGALVIASLRRRQSMRAHLAEIESASPRRRDR